MSAETLLGHSRRQVASCPEQGQHFVQLTRQDLVRLPVAAPEPHVPADCVLHTSLAEFSIGADKDRLMLGGPYRQLVISCARQASGTCCPALMTTLRQHLSHRGVNIVVKKESH